MAAPLVTGPDTERRFVELLLSRKLVIPELVSSLARERAERIARGERTKTLAHLVVDSGLVAHETAVELLQQVRSERASQRSRGARRDVAPQGTLGPGSQLGPYRITGELGRGGMGVVYRALDPRLQREVALKTISGLADEETIERFMLEARATARLKHPGIVSVLGAEIHSGTRVLVLELVEGRSLARAIAAAGPLPAREAAALVRDVALAVEAAHAVGIIHRDLKPANVLIGPDGRPRLTDFGLARDAQGPRDLTATGETLGTPAYMSPEQALADAATIGPATDVYGLGAVLYEALAGRPPFQGPSGMAILRAVIEETPLAPSVHRRSRGLAAVHADVETICLKALEKEPARRYPTAAALAADLSRFLEGEPIAARPSSLGARAWRRVRRHPALAAFLLLALAVVPFVAISLARTRARADARKKARDVAVAALSSVEAARRIPIDYDPYRPSVETEKREWPFALAREAARDYAAVARDDDAEGREARRMWSARAMELGETAMSLGDWPRAEAAFAEAALAGADPQLASGRRERAHAEVARDATLGRSSVPLQLLGALRAIRRFDAALRLLDRLIAEDGTFPILFVERAFVHRELGDLKGAAADLDRAIELSPRFTEALTLRASLRDRLGDHDGAIADASAALELHPHTPDLLDVRARLYLAKGDADAASRDLTEAIARNPGLTDPYVGRAVARRQTGDLEGSLADLERVLALDPCDERALLARGRLALDRGEREAATRDLERCASVAPSSPEAAQARQVLERLRAPR
jgi:tetratricopeptide (TPR) repeat protein